MTSAQDPFQTPAADPRGDFAPASGTALAPTPEEIATARRRLHEHTINPRRLEEDRAMAGPRFMRRTYVALGITAACVVGAAGLGVSGADEVWPILLGVLATVAGILALSFFIIDVQVGLRSAATTPKAALNRWFRAARLGRAGYALAALTPTGREGQASAPDFGGNEAVQIHLLSSLDSMKLYLKTFAHQDRKFVRWMQVKKLKVVKETDDVAVVSAEVTLTKLPQWAQILTIVLFVVIRLIGIIVGIVLFFSLRKTTKLTVEKTLLRGQDGLWYLLDGDLRR